MASYKQAPLTGITAAGTVPDSHRVPLHQADFFHQIAIIGGKDSVIQAKKQIKWRKSYLNNANKCIFLYLCTHESTVSHRSTHERVGKDDGGARADGTADRAGLQGAAVQVRA